LYLLTNQKEITNMAIGGAQPNLVNLIEELPIHNPMKIYLSILRRIIDNMEVIVRQNKILSNLNELYWQNDKFH
jgi:hypothetical protein